MDHYPPDCAKHSQAHQLEVILCTTLSLLQDHAQFVTHHGSLRNLELALQCAIADLKRSKMRISKPASQATPEPGVPGAVPSATIGPPTSRP